MPESPREDDARCDAATRLPPPAVPLSPSGLARRESIFLEMTRAARKRRLRRRTYQAAGMCAAAVAVAVSIRVVLTGGGTLPPGPQPGSLVDSHPGSNVDSPQNQRRVTTQYITGSPQRYTLRADAHKAVVAEQLSDSELSDFITEQRTFGLLKLKDRIVVIDNRPAADGDRPDH